MQKLVLYKDNRSWVAFLPTGWHQLYTALVDKIRAIDPMLRVEQAKEKFGSLRVYLDRYDERVDAIVKRGGKASAVTCQECGAPGVLRVQRGIYRTSCEAHASNSRVVTGSPIEAAIHVIPDKQEGGE